MTFTLLNMARAMNLSMWAQKLEKPMIETAACLHHKELPWTDDQEPSPQMLLTMRNICHQCPALIECAERASKTAEGGMYAGVWLPWLTRYSNQDIKLRRRRALWTLKKLVKVGPMSRGA